MPENLLTEWSRLLMASLADAGVKDLVLSPGSRNTPFVLAALHEPRLRVTDVIDERDAAFYALGQARLSGRPSALLCTSGTAGAHYLPAVIEADASGIPLIILTADRPFELIHVAANQAIEQAPLFSAYVRRAVDAGAPDASPSALRGLRRLAAQFVALATGPEPGPVHLNLRARKPLEPVAATSAPALALRAVVEALLAEPITRCLESERVLSEATLEALAARCARAERGLIVAGPGPLAQAEAWPAVAALAAASGFALCAEAASQWRFVGKDGAEAVCIPGFDWLYRLPEAETRFRPDFILQLGSPPTSGVWERYLDRHPEIDRVVIAPGGWPDPHNSARQIVHAELGPACAALAQRLQGRGQSFGFAQELAHAQRAAAAVIESELELAGWSEAAVARRLRARLPEQSVLVLGNSLSVRHVDAYCPEPEPGLRVLNQRGASGIDGLIAGAAGAASVTEAPVALLIGDVSLLHDVGGLLSAATLKQPLVIVAINNAGGRIFEMLPLAAAGLDSAMPHFTTPQAVDFSALARAYGLQFARVEDGQSLDAALTGALQHAGASLIEAVVAPHDAIAVQRRISAALKTAIGASRA